MTGEKKELLDSTFHKFMDIGFGQRNLHLLNEIVAKDVVGFGTAIDERLFGIAQLQELLTRQKQQSAGLEMKWEVTTLDLHISSDENTAVFTNEVTLEISNDRDPIKMYLRVSVVLEFEQHKWVVVHWHGSKPEQVESEKDTWGLDLWKAKADELEKLVAERTGELLVKNRELEVEAALERVRARTMAMEKSEELGEVATVLFSELNSLVDDLWTCGFVFCEENRQEDEWWLSLANGLIQPFFLPNVGDFTHEALYRGWENGEVYRTVTLENEMLKEHYDWLMNIPIARQIFDEMEGSGIPRPNWQRLHAAYFKTGYLVVITEIPCKEEEIFKRFAQVFDLTYTRFLDLQKAEAQAGEARIEAALEKVRSRSLAMHKADELLQVATVMRAEMAALGVEELETSSIYTMLDPETAECWYAIKDVRGQNSSLVFDEMTINLNATYVGRQMLEFFKSAAPQTSILMIGEQRREWINYCASCSNILKGYYGDEIPERTYHLVKFSHGYVGAATPGAISTESWSLLHRMTAVFSLAYRRFLDLQKAEAQARESQVQLALERVRARTMAMQKSSELPEAANLLFQQIQSLGMPAWSAGYCTWDDDEKSSVTLWMSSEGVLQPPFSAPTTEDQLFIQMRVGAEEGKDLHVVDLGGEELEQHYRYMRGLPVVGEILDSIIEAGHPLPTFQIMHQAYFSKGFLLFITYEPVPESHDVFKRFAKVFDQTYTRFLDLQKAEAQAREAQIEAALERVRSKAMAMHNSSDLPSTAIIAFSELKKLGFVPIRGGISIQNKENRKNLLYSATSSDKADNLSVVGWATLDNHPILSEIYNQWLLGNDYYPSMKGKVLQAYYKQIQPTFNIPLQFPDEEQFGYFMHFTHGTFYGWCKQAVTEEEKKLLKRFAAVVDLTFKRYFDLQKAEEQAKEAKIEAALERVRAKAMAMHSSNELREVVHELRKQMGILGQKNLETCVIHLHDESHEYIQSWAGIKPPDEEGDILESIANVPKRGLSIIEEALDAYNSNLQDYVLLNEGEKLRQWFSFLERESPEGFTKLVDSVHGNIEELRSYWSFADFAGGSLLMVTRDGPDELTRGLLRRFSNVFGLAYRRFADLKNAEAQAREARIEAALERVRSRSMAMHKSEELKEVIQVVYEQIVQLKIPTEHAGFIMDYKRRDDFDSWIADQFGSPSQLTIPYFDCIYYNRFNEAKAKGEDFFTTILSFEEKNRFYEELFEHIPNFPEESKNIIFSQPGFTISTVLLENVALYIENFTGISFSEEENAILMRFGKVFQQTYTRFLDLQKAEAQAREAEIQLALERVRAKTMAMQSSEELADAAYVLFEQLRSLGVTHERINIGIVNEESQTIDFWITEQGGDKLNTKFSGRISEPTTLSKAYTAWKNGEKSLMIDLQGDALKSWLSYLSDEIKIPFNKAFLHDRRVQTAGFFSKGMLILTSPEPLQQEALYLLEKFAGVFDLTYTRFSDLKLAEAQALQAEKDLIEIKIARQKAEEALAELKSTQAQLIQQEKLASLGQLTAGIAHEIKNPLNFVNNFSEVSIEMIEEVIDSRLKTQDTRPKTEADEIEDEILEDIKANLEKIHEHGSRANGIVTSMLQHSRGGSGKKEPTDLNPLIKEYVNLSFHGMRAGKNPIDVEIALELADTIREIPLVREDFTRVIINLCNNAFDAMRGKTHSEFRIQNSEFYHPKLTVRTNSEKDHILISVADNGPGIPDEIKDKILQPFFTTKKGTEGTGLGLSITHDIVKAHGGELKILTKVGEGTEFQILLPFNQTEK